MPVNQHQRMRVRLTEQILRLMDLIRRVDRNQHSARFNRSPKGDEPRRDVGRPNGYLVALLHTHRDQSAGERVHVVAELAVGARVIQRRVAERALVWEFFRDAVEQLREGEVDQRLFLPNVLTSPRVVLVKPAVDFRLFGVAAHIPRELREDDSGVLQVLRPALHPLKRHVAFIVDRAKGVHHLVDWQVALAHHAVFNLAVFHHGIFDMDIFYVRAEVLQRLFRRLARDAVGVVRVPQRGDGVVRHLLQQVTQTGGIGVYAVALHQQGNAFRGGDRRDCAELTRNGFVVHLAFRRDVTVG